MTTHYCPSCEEERAFRTENRTETYKVRGLEVSQPVTVEVCETCGASLSDEERDGALIAHVYAEYRQTKGLLKPEEIKAIRERYALSQKSFAALLGMSEATINRYEGGSLQEDTHDNMIRLVSAPEAMASLLERRGQLLSDRQRVRANEAIASELAHSLGLLRWTMPRGKPDLTGGREFDYSRYAGAAVWFCTELGSVYRTKLNKLLFYADFLAFKHFARSITGAAYRQIQHGPVPAAYGALEDLMERDDLIEVEEAIEPDGAECYILRAGPAAKNAEAAFTKDEKRALRRVLDEFRPKTCKAISLRSHQEDAYKKTPPKELISYQHARTLSLSLSEQ